MGVNNIKVCNTLFLESWITSVIFKNIIKT